ncbi:hypothetical protein [Streptomyces sp. 2-1]|uniref:hypothetical protein n=1 Tax=Streptomyces sp. 2-1 TaxID=412710 RepID=UPI003AFAE5C6
MKGVDVWGAWRRGEIAVDRPLIGFANPGRPMLTVDGTDRQGRGMVPVRLGS